MDEAERGLQELLLERLTSDCEVSERVADLVLAAWEGNLDAAMSGDRTAAETANAAHENEQRPEVFLGAVQVTGFRGIGEPAILALRPGPGLTLVTGRNGSGKSSFAEAAELALTGSSGRWAGRTMVWRDGWRNLHSAEPPRITVDLVTAGRAGSSRIVRSWDTDDDLDDGGWSRQRPGEKVEPFDGTEWGEDAQTYRPFLSYSELGALIDGRPSDLHDALHSLLGLGPLVAAQDRLRVARKRLTDQTKAVATARKTLRADLADLDDQRATRAAALLKSTAPDLNAVADLALGTDDDAAEVAVLRRIAGLEVPDEITVSTALDALRQASDKLTTLAGDETRAAQDVAALLRAALHHHDSRGDGPCPVCGEGSLDAAWRAGAERRADDLEGSATELRSASGELDAAMRVARALAVPIPPVIVEGGPVDTTDAREAWQAWAAAARAVRPAELTHALDAAHRSLQVAVADLQERTRQELSRREETWHPIAIRLAEWHGQASRAARDAPLLAELSRAEDWLKATAGLLRDERLAPFAAASQQVWQQLRQQSNVELGPVRLEGSATRRRVAMDVSIDGTDGGTALGVMSQGELHALALSLFLPRATVAQSPFRFVLIDDPVQAMDPVKVDGLARVLAEVAQQRQVVVFTHDDRLAEAVRRLQLPATVWEVQRRERSVVELRRSDDPVSRYLDDARAVAATDELPPDLRGELVASCCRSAIEAASHAKVRSVRLGRGDSNVRVDEALAGAHTTHKIVTLAVFDDSARGSELLGRLNREGRWAGDVLMACKEGAHVGAGGDLGWLIRDTRRLAEWVQR